MGGKRKQPAPPMPSIDELPPAPSNAERVHNTWYEVDGEPRLWDGGQKRWKCHHGNRSVHCKECGGGALCEHKKQKGKCKECGGSGICEHNKYKQVCKECGGSNLCEHGKQKAKCAECDGSGLCEHNKQRHQCKECGGSSICEHGKQKAKCWECEGSAICTVCLVTLMHRKYKPLCGGCHHRSNPHTESAKRYHSIEHQTVRALQDAFPNQLPVHDTTVTGGCSRKRPDIRFEQGGWTVIVGVDEHEHASYEEICENRRMMELFMDCSFAHNHCRPIIFIRFNPDKYTDECGVQHKSAFEFSQAQGVWVKSQAEWDMRFAALVRAVQRALVNKPEKEVDIVPLFYSAKREQE